MKKELGHVAIYDARELGVPRMLLLGLQHLFAMFGATVLVPILVSSYGLPLSIQTTLLFAGLGTLLFHLCTKFKVPAFLGSSFAFLGGFQAVAALDAGKFAGMTGEEKLPYALGGVVIAGLLYLVLALLFKLVGAKKVMRFFPPIVTGPIIILIGLNLSGTAIGNASTNWWLALVAIAVIIVANIWGKGMIKIIPILLGVVVSYVVALITGQVDFAAMREADIVGLQQFVIAKFDITSILVMAPIAIAAMMEHIGDISAISSTTGKNFIEDPGLRQLRPLRYDLRRRRPQRGREQGRPDQVPQPHHRRGDLRQRSGLQLHRRHHLHRGQRRYHPDRPGHRRSGRRAPERHPPRQRLRVRHQRRGRQVRRPGQLLRDNKKPQANRPEVFLLSEKK